MVLLVGAVVIVVLLLVVVLLVGAVVIVVLGCNSILISSGISSSSGRSRLCFYQVILTSKPIIIRQCYGFPLLHHSSSVMTDTV